MRELWGLAGQRVLVTGASSGIGKATCLLLGQLGAHVILVSRNHKRLNRTIEEMQGDGHIACPYDFTDIEGIKYWYMDTIAPHGPLKGIAHCAGVNYSEPLKYLKKNSIDETFQVNVVSGIYLSKEFRKKNSHVSGSSVVFVSSVMGSVGSPSKIIYSASKGALSSLAKSMALELIQDNIRVNCVAPGYVNSEMLEQQKKILTKQQLDSIEKQHPLGFGTPTDISNSICFLLSDMGRWITGTTLVVDGGYTAH
jgi:NAD(P)-dependent dehydrogenase (short-subunit alcohol dehydrogenase family)